MDGRKEWQGQQRNHHDNIVVSSWHRVLRNMSVHGECWQRRKLEAGIPLQSPSMDFARTLMLTLVARQPGGKDKLCWQCGGSCHNMHNNAGIQQRLPASLRRPLGGVEATPLSPPVILGNLLYVWGGGRFPY